MEISRRAASVPNDAEIVLRGPGVTTLCTLWVGGDLSYLERVCLASAIRVGHPVILYTYDGADNLPLGVMVRDAREVMSYDNLLKHKSGSFALGSDLFRYELLRKGLGCWIDSDLYLLKPLPSSSTMWFGLETETVVNGAILMLPSDSAALRKLRNTFRPNFVPPWWPKRRRLSLKAKIALGKRVTPEEMPWGTFGPKALTYYLGKHDLLRFALPTDVFYPIPWQKAEMFLDPAADIEAMITQNTIAIHFWNARLRAFKNSAPPKGSFLARVCEEHGISVDL